jgi:hypothetical protein
LAAHFWRLNPLTDSEKPVADAPDEPDQSAFNCGKRCIAALALIVILLILVAVFYEAGPTPGDLCKIYG